MEKRNWTNHEYFDEAVRYLASMDNRCTDYDTCLYYRKSDGSRCLVGHFISDSDIKMFMTDRIIDFDVEELVINHYPELSYLWPDESPNLAIKLQQIHDDADNWNDDGLGEFRAWDKLEELGREFNLDLTVLNKVKVA